MSTHHEGTSRLLRDLEDPKLIAFGQAMVRSEQLLTGALMAGDCDLWDRLCTDAEAIADEWGFTEDLRLAILEAARENAEMGRVI